MVSYFLILNLTFLVFKLSQTVLKAGKVSLGSLSAVAGVTSTINTKLLLLFSS